MSSPRAQQATATLEEVLLPTALAERAPHSPNFAVESQAFQALAQQMADDPDALLDMLSSLALELCCAGSSGVSLLEATNTGERVFRWVTLAGAAKPYRGGSTPADWSPCGTCLRRGAATLFSYPERHFTYFQQLGLPLVEGLVVPLRTGGRDIGTIWVITHNSDKQFDAEDVRLLEGLGAFTSAALALHQARSEAEETARLRAERATLAEWSTDAMIALELDGAIKAWNPAAERMLGYSVQDVLGRHLTFLCPPECHEQVTDLLSAVNKGEVVKGFITQVLRKDRQHIEIEINARSVLDSSARPSAIVGTFRDVTERRRVESATQYLAAIVESSDDAIISKDLNGIIRSWNKGAERIFGYTAEEMIGRPITILAVPERVEEIPNILARIRAGERVDHYETRRRTKDGRVLDISLTVSPIRDSSGAIIGASKIARDVTGQKRAQEELRASEESLRESESRYRLAIRAANSVIWDWYVPTGQVVWSELLESVFGYSPVVAGSEIAAATAWWVSHIHPDDRDVSERTLTGLSEPDTQSWTIEYRFERADGTWAHVLDQGYVARGADGRAVRVIGSMIDVTNQKAAQQELQRANEDLRTANRELQEFAFVASHDLKEPLRMVNSYTQLLLRRISAQDPQLVEYGEFVRTGVRRMEQMLDDLLIFSRVIHEQQPSTKVDLGDLLNETLYVLADQIRETSATISYDTLPMVVGDAVQLGQLFQNLIANALKYRRPGTAPEVRISAETAGGEWVVSVADNGIGFSPQYSEQIFGLFKRLHRRDIPGTGIGLAICRRIVERHGGRIWAESPGADQGASFRFTLPAREHDPHT